MPFGLVLSFVMIFTYNYINNLNHFQLVPFLFSSALICCSFPYICFPPLSLQYQFDHNVLHIQMAYATHTHTHLSLCASFLPIQTVSTCRMQCPSGVVVVNAACAAPMSSSHDFQVVLCRIFTIYTYANSNANCNATALTATIARL